MNRDTLYSGGIVDISKGATLTIPETNSRYVSAMVVNEDHFVNKVYQDPGTYKLTMEEFDTPYVSITIRILAGATDPADIKKANAIQDIKRFRSIERQARINLEMLYATISLDGLKVLPGNRLEVLKGD